MQREILLVDLRKDRYFRKKVLTELIFREHLSQTVRDARLTTLNNQVNALMSHISSISCLPMKQITLHSDIQQNFRNLGD